MTEFMDRVIRDRNVITLPKEVMVLLNISLGDTVGFDFVDGRVCLHKVVPHRMRNCKVGEDDEGSARGG